MQKESKRKETPKPSAEESPSPTSKVSSASSTSVMESPSCEVRRTTCGVSSVRTTSRQEGVGLPVEEISPSSQLRPASPPREERLKTCRVSSVRIPSQTETKPPPPSAWPVLPLIPQKAPSHVSKQVQGQKSTKGRGSGVYTCRLIDCPYHNKPKEGSVADRELGPVRTSTEPTVTTDLRLQKSVAGPTSFEVRVPYRPKGGPIVDPELVPKRTRAGPVTNRTTGTESTFLYSRQGTAYSRRGAVSEDTNSTNLSVESSAHTCPHLVQSVHITGYMCLLVQCSEPQPHSNITLPPNLKSQHQQVAETSSPSDPIGRNSSAMG